MDIVFKKPTFKKTYYVSHTQNIVTYDLIDVTIKKVIKLQNNNGHIFTLNISQNDKEFMSGVDDCGLRTLMQNNRLWFENDLREEDIKQMYNASYCSQSGSINVFLPNDAGDTNITNIKVFCNNKPSNVFEFLNCINDHKYKKQYTINFELKHIGMYIYADQTINKWAVRTIHIHNLHDVLTEDKEDIETSWAELVAQCDEILEGRIKIIEKTRKELHSQYETVINEKNSKKWESQLEDLKKLIQNIIF